MPMPPSTKGTWTRKGSGGSTRRCGGGTSSSGAASCGTMRNEGPSTCEAKWSGPILTTHGLWRSGTTAGRGSWWPSRSGSGTSGSGTCSACPSPSRAARTSSIPGCPPSTVGGGPTRAAWRRSCTRTSSTCWGWDGPPTSRGTPAGAPRTVWRTATPTQWPSLGTIGSGVGSGLSRRQRTPQPAGRTPPTSPRGPNGPPSPACPGSAAGSGCAFGCVSLRSKSHPSPRSPGMSISCGSCRPSTRRWTASWPGMSRSAGTGGTQPATCAARACAMTR
mmetsp:Transcript_111779/g.193990  ORF Transcript_111779/g.193990 Transcript_111779/m.193990 type:complete len:276 (+) Transcript_111779:95-922(+)